jgi:hypothetical protein
MALRANFTRRYGLEMSNCDSNNGDTPGEVLAYAGNGDLLGELTPPANSSPFHPKGVVVGPDGLLYVAQKCPRSGGPG